METHKLKCPLCGHEQETRLTAHQTAYRCKGCQKLVRAMKAPKKLKKDEAKMEAPNKESKKDDSQKKKRTRKSKKKSS